VDLKSPSTLVVAWLLVPLLIVVASAGLGAGLARISGSSLGTLTVPAGFMTGIALMTFCLEIGFSGIFTVVLCAALAAVGLLAFLIPRRQELLSWRPPAELLWIAGCAAVAFAIAMAPLVGSGRSGVLGYVFNNDSSVHISVVELLRDHGAEATGTDESSYRKLSELFSSGYPIGSHVWPLFGSVLGGIDAFHIWTPVMAIVPALMALVVFTVVRSLGAPPPFSAVAGAVVASGYLPYSYLAQGSAKETCTALALQATVALLVMVGMRARLRWGALLPAAIGAAAVLDIFGVGGLAWLAPGGVAATLLFLGRGPRPRMLLRKRLRVLALGVAVAAVVALPSVSSSLNFVESNRAFLTDPNQTGNLLGPVPWSEAFNVWFAYDYRHEVPDVETMTSIGVLLAALLGLAGAIHALRRRSFAIPLALITAIAGSVFISSRYAIYFDAKTYVVLAPALGMATAAGLLWLYRLSTRTQFAGIGLGLLLAAGVVISDGMVYAEAWHTPRERFQELAEIGKRFRDRGPILVNEREDYAKYFLRDDDPGTPWDAAPGPTKAFRAIVPPGVPYTPDFDDYTDGYMSRFRLLLERRRPGGSLPPGNFSPAFETAHYRVWQRVGPPARLHLSLGSTLSGRQKLDCDAASVRSMLRRAEDGGGRLRVAFPGARPILSHLDQWQHSGGFGPGPQKGFVYQHGGFAAFAARLPRGRYTVYAQGGFGPGIRLYVDGSTVGEVFGDEGLQDGWQPLGSATVRRSPALALLIGLNRPWWQSGSHRTNLEGPLAFEVPRPARRIADVRTEDFSSLCGRSLDWIELPAVSS
jgi:hypothetical protein